MDAAEQLAPTISAPLTWAEICDRYPDQHVCLAEIDRIDPRGLEFRTARVVGHGKTRREALDQALGCREGFKEIGFRFTGQNKARLARPSLILDDEIRHAIRYRR